MLASSRMRTPSAVVAGRRRSASAAGGRPVVLGARAARASVSGVGSTMSSLGVAVDDHELTRPGSSRLASCRPTTAGTSSERARIAVWYVRLPASVAKPRTFVQSTCAASDGVSSSATSTDDSSSSRSRSRGVATRPAAGSS